MEVGKMSPREESHEPQVTQMELGMETQVFLIQQSLKH